MAAAAKFRQLQVGTRWTNRILEILFTGNYVTSGDALNLQASALTNKASELLGGAGSYAGIPDTVLELNSSGGFYFEVIQTLTPGTLAGFVIKVYQPSGAELAAGAYPAALLVPASPFLIQMTHKTAK
jgi:hypothetical protein